MTAVALFGAVWSGYWAYNEFRWLGAGVVVAVVVSLTVAVFNYYKPLWFEAPVVGSCKVHNLDKNTNDSFPPGYGFEFKDTSLVEKNCENYLADTAE
ncbi:hypothetical protein JF546_19070 [Nitratireductor aquimarinus]|uniref:hypothetical protein n=1 Tax=Nitratireductor TaxID=245876 RepID=UPI001A90BF1D|nr:MULTISPECIES: hypothetical protein [Nitratireductor]MBN8245124.1 hypothetical protein [Nitratireductor aquimarinus]MBY6133509.1 hypothetical protein [Nitratireductor aquimarinus]MCA1304840.1 hypothetical protein [Nitratireductor aquimarinus]MCV0350220.1 hypothetical protein [Nitratireductor sp.]